MNLTALPRRLSPTEAASYIGVRKQTLAKWRCTGQYPDLPYYKVGNRITYCPKDVRAFVEARRMLHTSRTESQVLTPQ